MRSKLALDTRTIDRCREVAGAVSESILEFAAKRTTVSIERATLRLLGINGAGPDGTPCANRVIEAAARQGLIEGGICLPFGRAMKTHGMNAIETASMIARGEADLPDSDTDDVFVREMVVGLSRTAVESIGRVSATRDSSLERLGDGPSPLMYVIVASGDIHEDVVQARVAATAGAQVIAVIRHTAQSLLDYIPDGANTGGFGGTYASQDNFRIMREALDEVSEEVGRYVRLCNYASGLCMPEMSVLGALERLDMMLNDALYGILFRDINMQRTLTDQAFSRLVSAAGGIIINTGEDNYLTTADPMDAAHTVLASQFINESLALGCGLEPRQIGLGHAMEIDPLQEDMLLIEIAQARMVREIFPGSPIKYMPPTRHMTGNIFRGHVQDSMFALASVLTDQGIHLLGMMTEAMHTPHIHDRYLALESTRMVMNAARHLSDELDFRDNGIIRKRAATVLNEACAMLESLLEKGLFAALEDGLFADVSRSFEGGRGLDGVFIRSDNYWNPVEDMLKTTVMK